MEGVTVLFDKADRVPYTKSGEDHPMLRIAPPLLSL